MLPSLPCPFFSQVLSVFLARLKFGDGSLQRIILFPPVLLVVIKQSIYLLLLETITYLITRK